MGRRRLREQDALMRKALRHSMTTNPFSTMTVKVGMMVLHSKSEAEQQEWLAAMHQRKIGKSRALAAMYGMKEGGPLLDRETYGTHSHAWLTAALTHKGIDPRLGVHLYVASNKNLTMIREGREMLQVPHTSVEYVRLTPQVALMLWYRKHDIEEMRSAVATMAMMHDTQLCVVRAFSPEEVGHFANGR